MFLQQVRSEISENSYRTFFKFQGPFFEKGLRKNKKTLRKITHERCFIFPLEMSYLKKQNRLKPSMKSCLKYFLLCVPAVFLTVYSTYYASHFLNLCVIMCTQTQECIIPAYFNELLF
jgi:hypothetical protein